MHRIQPWKSRWKLELASTDQGLTQATFIHFARAYVYSMRNSTEIVNSVHVEYIEGPEYAGLHSRQTLFNLILLISFSVLSVNHWVE